MAYSRSLDRHLTVVMNVASRLSAAGIGPRRQSNQDHRDGLLNMLEAPFEAVDGVEQAADSIAVDIGDVAGDRCPKLPDRAVRCQAVLITQRSRVQIPPPLLVSAGQRPDRQRRSGLLDHPMAVRWRDRGALPARGWMKPASNGISGWHRQAVGQASLGRRTARARTGTSFRTAGWNSFAEGGSSAGRRRRMPRHDRGLASSGRTGRARAYGHRRYLRVQSAGLTEATRRPLRPCPARKSVTSRPTSSRSPRSRCPPRSMLTSRAPGMRPAAFRAAS
jgi:hypothetical protein